MNLIKLFSDKNQKIVNTIRAVGPYIFSQSEKMSEAYQRHLGRVAEVDVFKELLNNEIKNRGDVKKQLLESYVKATGEEKVRIERDLEFLDGRIQQLQISLKSLSYNTANPEAKDTNQQPITDHWIDKFNELARKRNEEWRSDLLARALACEAEKPGSVSPRALWLIGNMEEDLFKALSDLLNLCIWTVPDNSPILPHSKGQVYDRVAFNSEYTVGRLIYQLADIGVIADHLTCRREWVPGDIFVVRYGEESCIITPKKKLEAAGILFTPLGDSVAKFFKPEWNENGLSIFNDWLESIREDVADLKRARFIETV